MRQTYPMVMYNVHRIQQAMAEQFLSARQLAKKAKVAESTVLRIFETQSGNPETIGKLVRALKLNPVDIVVAPTRDEPADLPEPKTAQAEHSLVLSSRGKR